MTTWKPFITGLLALVVVGSTTAAALPAQTIPSPELTAPTNDVPNTKQASVIWKALDRTINLRSTSLGVSGRLAYSAPVGTTEPVTIIVSRLMPGTKTWGEISRTMIQQTTRNQEIVVADRNLGLDSGTVQYRVSVAPLKAGTTVSLPPDFTVDYTKTITTLVNYKLAGKTLTTDSLYPFHVTGTISGTGARPLYLQRYDATKKTWVNVNQVTAYPARSFNIQLPATKNTETYRTYSPATLTHSAHVGVATVVKRTSPKGAFYSQLIDRSRIAPWANNVANVYVTSRLATGEAAPAVTLQEAVKGRWVNIAAVQKQGRLSFTLPKGNTSAYNTTKTYRFVVNSTKFSDTGIGKTFTVRWENPRRYTGIRLTAYNYASRYCPNMLIDIKSLPYRIAGTAYMGTDVTALAPVIAAKDLRTVSLHECAHHRQWSLYKTNFSAFRTKMDKLYAVSNGKGFEYGADCIANVWHTNSYWAYGRTCSGQQLTAARMIASGKKY